ncbi:MAG: hypothetical protein ABUK01_01385 [Leptospirales bacterium]
MGYAYLFFACNNMIIDTNTKQLTSTRADLAIASEMPADYTDTSGKHPNGTGYCELVGFENTVTYRNRVLAFLKSGTLP